MRSDRQRSRKTDNFYLGILLVVVLLGADPSRHQIIPDAVRQGEEVVAGSGDVAVLRQSVVQVPVEGLLKVRDILDVDDTAHRDLLPLLVIGIHRRHDDFTSTSGNRSLAISESIRRERSSTTTTSRSYDNGALSQRATRRAPTASLKANDTRRSSLEWQWSPCPKVAYAHKRAVMRMRGGKFESISFRRRRRLSRSDARLQIQSDLYICIYIHIMMLEINFATF